MVLNSQSDALAIAVREREMILDGLLEKHGAKMSNEGKQLSKEEFDSGVKDGSITEPQIDSFGDGQGEPYMPNRKAWGSRHGETVWAWVRGLKAQEPVSQ
jgi:hypothetical protein